MSIHHSPRDEEANISLLRARTALFERGRKKHTYKAWWLGQQNCLHHQAFPAFLPASYDNSCWALYYPLIASWRTPNIQATMNFSNVNRIHADQADPQITKI